MPYGDGVDTCSEDSLPRQILSSLSLGPHATRATHRFKAKRSDAKPSEAMQCHAISYCMMLCNIMLGPVMSTLEIPRKAMSCNVMLEHL